MAGPYTNFKGFDRRMREYAKAMDVNAGTILQLVGEGVVSGLIAATPVGGPPTSPGDPHPRLAQSNWLAKVSRGAVSIDLSRRSPRPAAATFSEAASEIRGNARADMGISIANGGVKVPYLGLLNNGYSFQAPAGFVRLAVRAGILVLRGARLLRSNHGRGVTISP
jgi:hypothetical protein